MSIDTIIIVVLAFMAVIGVGVCTYVYLRDRSLENIRADVYKLFLKAENKYLETGAGRQKMKYVVSQASNLLPPLVQMFITDEMLEIVIQKWFDAVKDLLDDGRINKSTEGNENE